MKTIDDTGEYTREELVEMLRGERCYNCGDPAVNWVELSSEETRYNEGPTRWYPGCDAECAWEAGLSVYYLGRQL